MKVFFALGFLFIFHICCVLGYEGILDKEVYSDIGAPLILHSNNIILRDNNVGREQHGKDSCWSFSKNY